MSCSTLNDMDNRCIVDGSFDTVHAMRRQEAKYPRQDPLHQQMHDDDRTCLPQHIIDVDEVCRDKMCEWSYQIVDFCKFSRESVDIAMNYLDRLLLTAAGASALQDRNIYQLAAMTALYSAIKIHERQALSPKVVSQLSRGIYTDCQITEMETTLLKALAWKLHPPTAISFVRELLAALPTHLLDASMKDTVFEISQVQTELAVSDYRFIETPSSTVAFCAILNALECCGYDLKRLNAIISTLAEAIGLFDPQCVTVVETQIALYAACPVNAASCASIMSSDDYNRDVKKLHMSPARRTSFHESPRSALSPAQ
jgi:Cyclin, N-terminal domain/Cyclin, C-terminal domain